MTAAVPTYLIPHTVTVVKPAVTVDSYGSDVYDYGTGAERIAVQAWLQQDMRARIAVDGAEPLQQRWLLVANYEDIGRRDRIEWTAPEGAVVFQLDGAPEPVYTPRGFHHAEATLVLVEG